MTAIIILLIALSAAVVAAAVVPLAYAIGVDNPKRSTQPSARPSGAQAGDRDQRAGGLTPAGAAA